MRQTSLLTTERGEQLKPPNLPISTSKFKLISLHEAKKVFIGFGQAVIFLQSIFEPIGKYGGEAKVSLN